MKHDPRTDAYIAAAAAFARPILRHLREQVATHCAEAEESIRWRSPTFLYRGRILCNMAAFKAHVSFGFWQGSLVTGTAAEPTAMGQFGRITSLSDLPDDGSLGTLIGKAMALIDDGAKVTRPLKHPKPPIEIPEDFAVALRASAAAEAVFAAFPPGQQREYLEWIIGAKRPETRRKRLETSIAQLEEGKRLNWKYERC